MSILEDILQKRRKDIAELYQLKSLETWRTEALAGHRTRPSFIDAISKSKLSLIAEIKKASPSRGIIYESFNPLMLAQHFESLGADALSIITEPHFFQGNSTFLQSISEKSRLPLLRKDFIIDEVQLYESKLLGASAVLLIRSVLSEEQCLSFTQIAQTLGLDVLLEIHDLDEFISTDALYDFSIMWGINNRNLKTFEVDLSNALVLNKKIKDVLGASALVVAESGYQTKEHLDEIRYAGVSAVLIGEGLAKNPELMRYF